MQAIQLKQPCEPDEMVPVDVAKPQLKPGYILIQVKAFGVNESEVTSRKGGSDGDFSFPRILGIEAAGVVTEVNADSPYQPGQQVMTMMGGMGRAIDGGYAEYVLVKEANVIPFISELPWSTLGALPEMLQTAYGSLATGLQLKQGDTLLVRGGTSTVGLMAVVLGKRLGATVIATTRQAQNLATLTQYGADVALQDDASYPAELAKAAPNGVDKVLELVGLTALFQQDLKAIKQGGKACFTGSLAAEWSVDNFTPFMIPTGVYLTSYAGEATDLPADVVADVLKGIEAGSFQAPIGHEYHGLASVGQAHQDLEAGKYNGKLVVTL